MDLLGGYGSDDTSSSSDEDTTPAAPPSTVSPYHPPSSAVASLNSSEPVESSRRTRGKRLVSLHAVLPPHILNQLTKGAASGGMDSDEEEEEVANRPTQDSKRHTTVIGKDEGLSSFLSELKSAPTTTFRGGGAAEKKPSSSEPLGRAFTTTQTVVVSRTKGEEVMDVHAKQPEPALQSNHSESERDPETTTKPLAYAGRPAAPRPSSSVNVPRPGTSSHPIVSAPLPAPLPTMMTEQPRQQFSQYQLEPDEEESKIDPRLAKKRSRKEMEKALRAGNLDALQGVATVEAEASVYIPQEETYRVPTSGITKVAPVSMYDPKAGSDVMQVGATGKQRGKHQINTLLASAASLELQRARAIGTSGGKSKRADAKRKYGW